MGLDVPYSLRPTDGWALSNQKTFPDEFQKTIDKKPAVTPPTAQPTPATLDDGTQKATTAEFPTERQPKGPSMDNFTGVFAEMETTHPTHAPKQPESAVGNENSPGTVGLGQSEAQTARVYSAFNSKPIQQLFHADQETKTNAMSLSARHDIDSSLRSLQDRELIKRIEESKKTTQEGAAIGGSVVEDQLSSPHLIPFSHTEYRSYKLVPFTTIKQLGHGSLGSVDAVRQNDDELGPVLARKVIRLPNIARKRLLPIIQQEVAVLRSLTHRHIIQVVSTYETTSVPRQFGIILSPAGDEDLSHYLERTGDNEFPEEDLIHLRKWLVCLASAVAYIHSKNVRHKDIKPNNIICKAGEVFLTDFGSAHQFTGLTSSTEGYAEGVTKMYSAPEVIACDRRGRSADVYSLGCVFAEMCTVLSRRRIEDFHEFRSEMVPDEPDRITLIYSATAHKLEAWFALQHDPWPLSLTSRMMAEDPATRPTAEDLLKDLTQLSIAEICNCHSIVAAYDEAENELFAFEDDLNHVKEITFPVATTVGQNSTPKSAHSVLSSPIFLPKTGYAYQASIALYKTLQKFESESKQLCDLNEELEDLSKVLGSFIELLITPTDVDLYTLNVVLRQCGDDCKKFEQAILRYSSRPGGIRTNPQDWAKFWADFRHMGNNINDFRLQLTVYKSTLISILASLNFAPTVESLSRQLGKKPRAAAAEQNNISLKSALSELSRQLGKKPRAAAAEQNNLSLKSALSELPHMYLENQPETATSQSSSRSLSWSDLGGIAPSCTWSRVEESEVGTYSDEAEVRLFREKATYQH